MKSKMTGLLRAIVKPDGEAVAAYAQSSGTDLSDSAPTEPLPKKHQLSVVSLLKVGKLLNRQKT